jgi:DNA replication protein DnaC
MNDSNHSNEQLSEKLQYLRLKELSEHWDEYLQLAAKKNLSHDRLLRHVIDEQYRVKRENARRLRLQKARIAEALVIETFPFARQPRLNKKKIMALYDSVTYMHNSENIVWLGATGCGKTGLATSFLIHAINSGYSGRHVLFAELVGELYQSVADHSEAKVLKKYGEPAWNYQVIRFLTQDGKDIIPRKDKVNTINALATRMVKALEKAKQPVPPALRGLLNKGPKK